MKTAGIVMVVALLNCSGMSIAEAQDLSLLATQLSGATIVGQDSDNTYLGSITNGLKPDSVFNEIGRHGSEIGTASIWNNISQFGSEIGVNSAFNDICARPPAIVKNGRVIGYLTTNRLIRGGVSPHILKALKDSY